MTETQTRRPTTKLGLAKYYEALHFALEREFTGFPDDIRAANLRAECIRLEQRLESVPCGDDLIETARWNATHASNDFYAAPHEERFLS